MVSLIRRVALSSDTRDYYGGALMLAIGLGAVFEATNYRMGDLRQMGPGFFPTAVGVMMSALGVAIAMTARHRPVEPEQGEVRNASDLRGWACILGGGVAFVLLGIYGGLFPATFAIVFLSALGDRQNTIVSSSILALAICLLCTIVFWWGLRLQFPLFTWG